MLDQPAHRNMAAADAVPGKGEADAQAIVPRRIRGLQPGQGRVHGATPSIRSEEHTSELQSLMRISYAVFCLKKKKEKSQTPRPHKTSHRKQQVDKKIKY